MKSSIFNSDQIIIQELKILRSQLTRIEAGVQMILLNGEDRIISNSGLRSYLKVSKNQLYKWRESGELRYYRKGRMIFYSMSDVVIFIKSSGYETIYQ